MKRYILVTLGLLVATLLMFFLTTSQTCYSESKWEVRPCKVVRVVDGDTIVVTGWEDAETKIRMLNVNTPESVHPDASKNTPEGKKASEFTSKHLAGATVMIQSKGEKGNYGRLLAYVFINYNILLIQEGHSDYYIKYGKSELYDKEFQNAAKKDQDGLADVTVFKTESGTKYHREGCVYLKTSKIPISLKKAKEEGLTPCSRCSPAR